MYSCVTGFLPALPEPAPNQGTSNLPPYTEPASGQVTYHRTRAGMQASTYLRAIGILTRVRSHSITSRFVF
jgi:hypothetical protein